MSTEYIVGVNISELPDPFINLSNNKVRKVWSSRDVTEEYLLLAAA